MKVTMTLELDLQTAQGMKVYTSIAEALEGTQEGAKTVGFKKSEPKKEAPAAPATSAQTAPAPTAAQAAAPAPDATPSIAAPAAATSKTIAQVRALLGTKVENHRDAIKEKLAEFEAPSVTLLKPEFYDDMYAFLESLG